MMQCKTLRRFPKLPALSAITLPALRAITLMALLSAASMAVVPAAVLAGGGESYFVAGIEDLPLMGGLAEVADAGVSFDKPEGRIVTGYAHGPLDEARVRGFYRETLPQLGWEAAGRDLYLREGEALSLDFLGRDGDLTVRYTLQPQ